MKKAAILGFFGIALFITGLGLTGLWMNMDCDITKNSTVEVNGQQEKVTKTINGGPLMCSTQNMTNMLISILGPLFIFSGGTTIIGAGKLAIKN